MEPPATPPTTPPSTAPVAAPRPALPPPPAPTAPPTTAPTTAPLAVSAAGSKPVCWCAHDSQCAMSCPIRSGCCPFVGDAYTLGLGGAVAHPVVSTTIRTPDAMSRFMPCPPSLAPTPASHRAITLPSPGQGLAFDLVYDARGYAARAMAFGNERQRTNMPGATVSPA